MSTGRQYVPQWLPVPTPKQFVESYGFGLLCAATIFGAGSVYILSTSGARFGYALLWMIPLAGLVDLGMREMAGRFAAIDEPLMVYIRTMIGAGPAKVLSVLIAFIMHFWAISNYAIAGTAFAYLTPLDNVYLGILLVAGFGLALVEFRVILASRPLLRSSSGLSSGSIWCLRLDSLFPSSRSPPGSFRRYGRTPAI